MDIRDHAGSRYRPQFSGKRLKAHFGEAYVRLRELGNLNHAHPGAPIVLRNPAEGYPRLIALLEQQAVCLLCGCQTFSRCHSAVVVTEVRRSCSTVQVIRLGEAQ